MQDFFVLHIFFYVFCCGFMTAYRYLHAVTPYRYRFKMHKTASVRFDESFHKDVFGVSLRSFGRSSFLHDYIRRIQRRIYHTEILRTSALLHLGILVLSHFDDTHRRVYLAVLAKLHLPILRRQLYLRCSLGLCLHAPDKLGRLALGQ